MSRALPLLGLLLAPACCFSPAGDGAGGTPGGTGSGSGSTSGGPRTDAGCAACVLGGGGFGSGEGFCLSACPPDNHLRPGDKRCLPNNVPASCGYAAACGASYACLDSDSANCGFCGHACPAGATCQDFHCGILCHGVTVDPETDSASWGACDQACPAGQLCRAGVCGDRCACGATCPAGQLCVGAACGPTCDAGQVCAGGCESACPAGLFACGGACVDLQNDARNCGACGQQCGDCVGGSCVAACDFYGPDAGA